MKKFEKSVYKVFIKCLKVFLKVEKVHVGASDVPTGTCSLNKGHKKQIFTFVCILKRCLVLILTKIHLNMVEHDKPDVEMM